jgi:transcriptional regulator with XRE-family HTH domain
MPTTKPKQLNETPARVLFGIALRRAREEQGVSQEQLAERAGLHRTYIGQVERGEKNISIGNMEHLAHAVGLQVWEMIRPLEG